MWSTLVAAFAGAVGGPWTTVSIVRVVAPPEQATIALPEVERAAEVAQSWFLDAAPLVDPRARLAVDRAVRRCGEDNLCVSARLKQLGVDRGVYVVANLSLEPALVTVEVLDANEERTVARSLVSSPSGSLENAAERAVRDALSKAGHRLGGRLTVEVLPGDAELSLQSASGVWPERTDLLAPGTYRLDARRDGYEPASQTFEIQARASARLSMQLTPVESIWGRWWLWAAVGTAVAAGVAAAIVVTSSDSVKVCHPVGGPSC